MFSLGRGQNWFPLLINMLLSCKLGSGMLKIIPIGYCFKKSPMRQKDTFTENNLFNEFTWTLDNLFPNLGKVVFQKKHNSFYMPANTTTFCSLLIKGTIFHPLPFAFIVYSMALIRADVWISLFPNMFIWGVQPAEKSEKSSYEEYSRLRNLAQEGTTKSFRATKLWNQISFTNNIKFSNLQMSLAR